MLPRNQRLTKKKEFDRVFSLGQGLGQAIIAIKFCPNGHKTSSYGIIISNKISKKATERNRLKRVIREIVKKIDNKVKSGYDIVIIGRPGIKEKKRIEIEPALIRLIFKSGLAIA